MNNEKFQKYTIEIIAILKKRALEAKKDADTPKDNLKSYAQGVLMGYYSIIKLLKHQSFVFCIDQKELGLADINPDVDLLGLHQNPDIEGEEDNWAIGILNEKKVIGYLSDTILLLKKQAIEAKEEADHPKSGTGDYNKGELLAYYCTFAILKQQAKSMKINETEIDLADIDSELFTPLNDLD